MTQISDVVVIGLGAIGWGVASSLIRDGFSVYGVDVNQQVLDKLAEKKGIACATPAEAVQHAKVVMLCVVNQEQAEQVLFGEHGAVAAAEAGTLFILSSTIAPSKTIQFGKMLEDAGMLVVDAPVIGGPRLALNGDLIIMAAGSSEALKLADPVFDAISARVDRLGTKPGQASQIKMINQLLTDVNIAATAEAMTLAAKTGIDLETMIQVISHSSGNSWAFDSRSEKLLDRDFTPRSPISNITKDLGIVENEAVKAGLVLPLTHAALTLFSKAVDQGLGQEDGVAIAKILEQEIGNDSG